MFRLWTSESGKLKLNTTVAVNLAKTLSVTAVANQH